MKLKVGDILTEKSKIKTRPDMKVVAFMSSDYWGAFALKDTEDEEEGIISPITWYDLKDLDLMGLKVKR